MTADYKTSQEEVAIEHILYLGSERSFRFIKMPFILEKSPIKTTFPRGPLATCVLANGMRVEMFNSCVLKDGDVSLTSYFLLPAGQNTDML